MFQIPDHVRPIRDRVLRFVEDHVIPHEAELDRPWHEALPLLRELHGRAKAAGVWALGHPSEIGGGGMAMRHAVHCLRGGHRLHLTGKSPVEGIRHEDGGSAVLSV